jgi:hypothetical protein
MPEISFTALEKLVCLTSNDKEPTTIQRVICLLLQRSEALNPDEVKKLQDAFISAQKYHLRALLLLINFKHELRKQNRISDAQFYNREPIYVTAGSSNLFSNANSNFNINRLFSSSASVPVAKPAINIELNFTNNNPPGGYQLS